MNRFKFISKIFNNSHHLDKWSMVVIISLFVVTSFLALPEKKFGDYPVFNSPDETANYLFTSNYVKTGKFIYDDIFAAASGGQILPRSMQVVFSRVTPTAFIGLPLIYGLIGKIVGVNWVIFFTPIIMGLALLVLYFSLLANFDKKFSWLCVFFIVINPAWLYSATRPMMTTGIFASFIILSLALFLFSIKYQRSVFYALTGVFFGLAILVRVSELVWLLPLALVIIYFYKNRVYWLGLVLSALCVLPSIALIGNYNYQHFASPWHFGYNNVSAGPSQAFIKTVIFPFGVNLQKAWQHLFDYTFILFPLWSVATLLALSCLIYKLYKQKQIAKWIYFFVGVLLAGYLVVYYGSWTFFDNPKQGAITIGSSYVRYFLPLMLLSAPLIAYALTKIKNQLVFILVSLVLICGLTFSSYKAVWLGSDEGVKALKITLAEYKIVRNQILQLTPQSSIIVADRMDKAVFPFRRVYAQQIDWQTVAKYLFPRVPAYLLSKELTQADFEKKQNEIKDYNLQILNTVKLSENFYLYQITKIHE